MYLYYSWWFLSLIHVIAMCYIQSDFALGQEVWQWLAWQLWCQRTNSKWKRGARRVCKETRGKIYTITLIWRIVLLIIYKACSTQSLHNETMATLSQNAGLYAWYPASRNTCLRSCQLILLVGNTNTQSCQHRGGRCRGSNWSSTWFTHGYSSHSIWYQCLFNILYHPFLHQILALLCPLLLVAQSLHHLHLFLQQSPNLLSNMTFLWAQCILSPPAVMLAAASSENASMMQDWQVVCSPLAPSEHQRVQPTIWTLLSFQMP